MCLVLWQDHFNKGHKVWQFEGVIIYLMVCPRWKATSPFYGEFMAPPAASPPALDNAAAADLSVDKTLPAGTLQRAAMSPIAVSALVRGAVLAVLGTEVSADQPLMEAGLDSLGKSLLIRFNSFCIADLIWLVCSKRLQ